MKKVILLMALSFCFLQFTYTQTGKLDSSFNGTGWLTANFPKFNLNSESAWQILLKEDSSYIVELGDENLPFALAHFFSNGTLDKSFGKDGYSVVKRMTLSKAALQSDGKIVVAGTFGNYDSSDFAVARYNANGSLDSTFGNNGMQTTNFLLKETAATVAIQDDGKIVVGGYTSDNGQNEYGYPNTYFAIARYNTDGTLDETFNLTGKQITDFQLREPPGEKDPGTPEFDYADAIAIQKDGKIVLAGYNLNKGVFALARYKTDGAPDSTFNQKGRQITNFSGADAQASSIAIGNDGKIVIAGYAEFSTYNFALARYNSDGSPDSTFNYDGRQITDFGSDSRANSIVMLPDNKIILAGYTGDILNTDFALARYNIDGSLDDSFNNNGKQITNFFGASDVANSVALQKDGKIVVVGEAVRKDTEDYNSDFAFAKYNSDGSLDTNFSDDGRETAYIPAGQGNLQSIAVQADKKILVAGSARNSKDRDKIFISRYNINGSPDNTFGHNGILTPDFGYSNEYCYAMAVQQDGKIVIAGAYLTGHNTTYNVDTSYALFARYNKDGSADSTFGKNGSSIPNLTMYLSWAALCAAIQNDGKIVVDGLAIDSLFQYHFAVARFNANGSLDKSFSNDGKQTTDFTSLPDDGASSIAVQENGKIIAAGSAEIAGNGNFAVARYNSNGSLDKSFSSDGKHTVDFSADGIPANSGISSIALQKDGKAVAAGSSYTNEFGEYSNFALARFNDDGSLDSTFDNDGKLTTAFGSDAYAGAVKIQKDGKIVAAGAVYNRDYSTDIALTRYNSNGSADTAFGVNGKIITDLGGSEAVAEAALQDNTLYVTGNNIVAVYNLSAKHTPPAVSLTAPANNAAYLAPAAHIKLSATASDSDGAITKVEFYNGNTLLHTETAVPYGFVWKNVPLGNYTLIAKAYDNSGNVTTSAPVHIFVVANKPPVVSFVKPANNQSFAAPAYIHFEAAASDSDGRITSVEFYNGSTLLRTENKSPYTYVWKNVPEGTYTITAVATDNWGAQTISSPITVRVTSASAIVSNRPYSENEKIALNDALSLRLSPNPANNILNIYTNRLQQNKPATISIISVSGIVLKMMRVSNAATQLDISSFASGAYTLKMVSGDRVQYKQFVKM